LAEALLAVTDDLAQGSSRGAIIKAYKTVRDGARNHIEAALPSVDALVDVGQAVAVGAGHPVRLGRGRWDALVGVGVDGAGLGGGGGHNGADRSDESSYENAHPRAPERTTPAH
jgi:hypothetical protein